MGSSLGRFPDDDIAHERLTGRYVAEAFPCRRQVKKPATAPIPLKPSKQELLRLTKNKIRPDIRYHYRLVAGALAVKAAGLLDDNTEELADVMNPAGQWVKDRDEEPAAVITRYWKGDVPKRKSARRRLPDTGLWTTRPMEPGTTNRL